MSEWIAEPWMLAALVGAALVVASAALWLHLRYWVRRLALRLDYAHVEHVTLEDGGVIELRRLPGSTAATPTDVPVLLVHGICANHRNQDMHPNYSLARFLASIGRDVWLLTLRCGRRRRAGEPKAPATFASMAAHDVPVAVRTVLQRTGASQLDYVGFSMGGMLLYAALDRSVPQQWIHRAVFVGSPGRIVPVYPVPRLLGKLPRSLVPRVPTRFGARLFAFLSEWFVTPIHRIVVNPSNVAIGITRIALVDCIEDIPGPLMADFLYWATDDAELRVDGKRVLDALRDVRVPALFIAGSADRIGPAPTVKLAHDAWGADGIDKRFRVLGRDFGSHEDYGHGDLAVGAHVGVELFQPIEEFLTQQPAPALQSGAQRVAAAAPRGARGAASHLQTNADVARQAKD